MSMNRWTDTEIVVHNMQWNTARVLKKHTFESVLMRWMNLESIIQSEVNQKGKHKYCV